MVLPLEQPQYLARATAARPKGALRSGTHRPRRRPARRWAFTLIELLTTVAIVGLLVTLLLPAVQAARETARRSACSSNLRQIGVALHAYHAAHGTFPPGCLKKDSHRHSWCTFLLPYVDQDATWRLYAFSQAARAAANRTATGAVIETYLCPSTARSPADRRGQTVGDKNNNGAYDPGDFMACSDYGGIYGSAAAGVPPANGVMIFERPISLKKIRDGASQTFIAAEDTGRGWKYDGEWANGWNIFDVGSLNIPYPVNFQQDSELYSDHPHGANALLCDGCVRFVADTAARRVVQAFCTRAGSEAGGSDLFR